MVARSQMNRICPICKNNYDDRGDFWKKICYQCYQNYRGFKRINRLEERRLEVYLTHPTVTKDELDAWIKSNGYEPGWGAEEWLPENWDRFKIWTVYTYFD